MDHGRVYNVNAYLLYFGGRLSSAVGGFSTTVIFISHTFFGPFGQIKISERNCRLKNRLMVG